MPHLAHCIYFSTATRDLSADELSSLLQNARELNSLHDLTGMLIYSEGVFFQALEGPENAVASVYSKIEADKRHEQIMVIACKAIPKRAFGGWSMGFASISREELAWIQGTNDFFREVRCFAARYPNPVPNLLVGLQGGHRHPTYAGVRPGAPAS